MSVTGTQHFEFLVTDLDPGIFKDFFGRKSSVRVLLKNLVQKLLSGRRDMLWTHKFFSADVRVELFVILTFEWELTAQKSEQQNTKGPYISWWA